MIHLNRQQGQLWTPSTGQVLMLVNLNTVQGKEEQKRNGPSTAFISPVSAAADMLERHAHRNGMSAHENSSLGGRT